METAEDCAGCEVAALDEFCAEHFHPLDAAGSVNTRGWEPEQDVPTPTEKRAVPFAVTAVGEVQPPLAREGAVPEIASVEAMR